MSTESSNAWLWSPSSHDGSDTPPGFFPFTSTCVGLTTIASAISGSASDTRLMREGEVITSDLPTSKCNVCGSDDSCAELAGACATGVGAGAGDEVAGAGFAAGAGS